MSRKIIGVGIAIALLAIAIPMNVSSHFEDRFTYFAPHTQSWVIWDTTPTEGIARGVGIGSGVIIWCASGGHDYTPISDPPGVPPPPSGSGPGGIPRTLDQAEDYINEVDTWELSVEGWLFSGEPECLAGDVLTDNEESAISGGAFVLNPGGATDHFDTTIAIYVIDAIEPLGEVGFTTFIDMTLFCTPASVDSRPCPAHAQGDYQGSDVSYACRDTEPHLLHPLVDETLSVNNKGNGLCDTIVHRECDDSQTDFDIPEVVPDHRFQTMSPPLKLVRVSVHALFVDLTIYTVCISTTGVAVADFII